MTIHILEIEQNAEGDKLAYLFPIDENGNAESGYRIAGPKAWGGSKNIARLELSSNNLLAYIKQYAPEVVEAVLKAEKAKGGAA